MPVLELVADLPKPPDVQRVFDAAVVAELEPVQVPDADWRVAIAHPFGLPGRVWLDTVEDVAAVVRERSLVAAGLCDGPRLEAEDEWRAAA
jgi:hypothetical protein